jgi:hypothetical protein
MIIIPAAVAALLHAKSSIVVIAAREAMVLRQAWAAPINGSR